MFFKIPPLLVESEVIYLPKHTNVPPQDSPQCYYFSFLHLRAMQGKSEIVPPYVKGIIEKIKLSLVDEHKIIVDTIIQYADDLLWIKDELDDKNENSSDNENENNNNNIEETWPQDFVDQYGMEMALAKLLGLQVKSEDDDFKDDFTSEKLKTLLLQRGPFAIRSQCAIELPENEKPLLISQMRMEQSTRCWGLYNIEEHLVEEHHCILVIGCQIQPTPRVYFIDPNYPQHILFMSFQKFKDNISIPEYVYYPDHQLKPDKVVHHTMNEQVMNPRKRKSPSIFKEGTVLLQIKGDSNIVIPYLGDMGGTNEGDGKGMKIRKIND